MSCGKAGAEVEEGKGVGAAKVEGFADGAKAERQEQSLRTLSVKARTLRGSGQAGCGETKVEGRCMGLRYVAALRFERD